MAEHQLTCRTCGKQFTAAHERGYCQQKCTPGHIAKMARKRAKRATAAPRAKASTPITHTDFACVVCGKTFRPKHPDRTKCCGRECGLVLTGFTAAARKTGVRVSVSVVRNKCKACGKRHSLNAMYCGAGCYPSIYHKITATTCLECGVEFKPSTTKGNHSHHCTDECRRKGKARKARPAKKLRRALKRGANGGEAVDPIRVFERDGWRCASCRKGTPLKLRGTIHARAPELDHIVPVSMGGKHTYANTQCLCRSCNGRKGATVSGQLHLFPRGA